MRGCRLSRAHPNALRCDTNGITVSSRASLTFTHRHAPSVRVNNDCVTVDELLLEIADYANNYQEMAAEKLKRLCATSYAAYEYLQDRVHDPWLPERTRQYVRDILLHIRIMLRAFDEYGHRHPYE